MVFVPSPEEIVPGYTLYELLLVAVSACVSTLILGYAFYRNKLGRHPWLKGIAIGVMGSLYDFLSTSMLYGLFPTLPQWALVINIGIIYFTYLLLARVWFREAPRRAVWLTVSAAFGFTILADFVLILLAYHNIFANLFKQ